MGEAVGPSVRGRATLAALFLILAVVAAVNFRPHWFLEDIGAGSVPAHMDEYVHWGYAQQSLREGRVNFSEPFSGAPAEPFHPALHLHEHGFYAFLAGFQDATGIGWMPIFTFGPTILILLLGIGAFLLGQRWNAGLACALWVMAIPTTLRFLGPAYMVPVAFALPLLAGGFILLLQGAARPIWLLGVVVAAAWTVHAIVGTALTVAAIAHATVTLRRSPSVSVLTAVSVTWPLVLAWPYFAYSLGVGSLSLSLPLDLPLVRTPGPALFGAAAIGAFALAISSEERARAAAWTLASVLMFGIIVIVHTAQTRGDLLNLYDRVILVLYFAAAILAGVATRALAELAGRLATRRGVSAVTFMILLVVQSAAVGQAVSARAQDPHYLVTTENQLSTYAAAGELLGPEHELAIVDGISTMPFSIATGIPTYFVRYPSSGQQPAEIDAFFAGRASDTYFLVENGISVVATSAEVRNPDLHAIVPGVYALRADYVYRMHADTR